MTVKTVIRTWCRRLFLPAEEPDTFAKIYNDTVTAIRLSYRAVVDAARVFRARRDD